MEMKEVKFATSVKEENRYWWKNLPCEKQELKCKPPVSLVAPYMQPPRAITPSLLCSTATPKWSELCFYISPIGEENSEQRKHSDLLLSSIVQPALAELGLVVVRADAINVAGMVTAQISEYIANARLAVADLSFHNPNVFYELSTRHALAKPTIHLIRKCDPIPFDVHNFRTIVVDTSSIYTFMPQLECYKASVLAQARRLLESTHPT